MENQTVIIGIYHSKPSDMYVLFIRCNRGFKHRISIHEGTGMIDFYHTVDVPTMTEKEYVELPNKV